MSELPNWAVWLGVVTGPLGLALSLLQMMRDRPAVQITLHFVEGDAASSARPTVRVTIANIGRRPAFVWQAHITGVRISGGTAYTFLGATLGGRVLEANGAPQHVVEEHADIQDWLAELRWWTIRAHIVDVTGKPYSSLWLSDRPWFAREEAPPGATQVARIFNWWTIFRLRHLT